jgi:hypothetical protein|tara:strand:- start:6115 stop:6402 length:288 start_codon:yes stop_codon:yes gene_type:complete
MLLENPDRPIIHIGDRFSWAYKRDQVLIKWNRHPHSTVEQLLQKLEVEESVFIDFASFVLAQGLELVVVDLLSQKGFIVKQVTADSTSYSVEKAA